MPFLITKCEFCDYATSVKCNLKRHQTAKHSQELLNKNNKTKQEENVSPNEGNVSPGEENVCYKCNKVYKTKKYLLNHEIKCKGIDELTCSKCMISFTTRAAKSRHIKANKCVAKSIIHTRTPNVQNISVPLLSTDLIKDNTEVLLMYCDNNEIKDTNNYDHIQNKLFIIYDKSDNQKYNQVLAKIKDLIKNSNKEEVEE